MSNEQDGNVQVQNVEQPLHFPFPLADHSLELPKEYTELQAKCPVARVKMPYGGDALLLTRHADIAKAANDARRCGTVRHLPPLLCPHGESIRVHHRRMDI